MSHALAVCAIGPLVLEQEQVAAHDGDAVTANAIAADGDGRVWVVSRGEDAALLSWTQPLVEQAVARAVLDSGGRLPDIIV